MQDVVQVRGLEVVARDEAGDERLIVKGVDFAVGRNTVLALIGESGSGKTTIAMALMGYARPGCRISGVTVEVAGTEVLKLSRAALADFRGKRVTYVPQSAAAAFNPSRRLMGQVIEGAAIHDLMPRADAEAKAVDLFRALALPDPETIGQRFPHQVSGGQLQRLMAAMALLSDPELVILDEPTTALDVTTQIEVLRAFKKVVRERGTTAIYVSHDLAVVAQVADRIVVLRDGEIQEQGETEALLDAPQHSYTQSLLKAADPTLRQRRTGNERGEPDTPLLLVRDLVAGYGRIDAQGRPAAPVLSEIGFSIRRGSVLGVVGESGCGKSTLARVIAGLLPAAQGWIKLDGETLPASAKDRSRDQLRRIQIAFQMADTALNPARTVARILGRPLEFYHGMAGDQQRRRVRELLEMVRLPAEIAERYPSELSGGQKQRINLARALAAEPELILCDEVTSSLDTVVGAAIIELLDELRRALGVAYLFISHDLSTVRAISDEVMVLYAGRTVEFGGRQSMAMRPLHPYTDLLISSVPELKPGWLESVPPAPVGEGVARPRLVADACAFYRRCGARLDGICDRRAPVPQRLTKGAEILCHRTERELLELQAAARNTEMVS